MSYPSDSARRNRPSAAGRAAPRRSQFVAAGAYVKALRRAHQLTQSDLAEHIEVGRGTIERIEHGDDHVYVGTVVRVLTALGAAPWQFFDLATEQSSHSLEQARHQLQIVRGIATYVRVLAEQRRAPLLTPLERSAALPLANEVPSDAISLYALLLALIDLDTPLADLAPIVRASADNEVIGRRMAEARGAFPSDAGPEQAQDALGRIPLPSLDAMIARLAAILRVSHTLPLVLKHDLLRLDAYLKRYRALLAVALSHITAEP